ncbi:MAG: signal recognition particle protein [Candidatus Latescibacteria bacterium]|nr:signal recognition particle protein [Candidatus Latescibacterota bacterium]
MFDRLSERFEEVFRKLRGQGRLTEKDIDEALREVRRTQLDADVNFKVARDFLQRIKERANGQDVLKSLTPGQQVIKVVYEELVTLLGGVASPLKLSDHPPTVIMMVGLQGCGKTTAAGKLALRFKSQGRPPLLVAADIYRPAAVEQLQTLGRSIGVPVYTQPAGADPVAICRQGVEEGRRTNRSAVIFDTAGRLSIDEEMMEELAQIQRQTSPHEILFVADSMLGQDAVETASRFYQYLSFTGCLLTKMDSDARGGAALSIRQVTGQPIKFVSTGEKLEALEPFHPDRMASRILGMGDILSLVEKAEQAFEREQAQKLEARLRKEAFTFEDFFEQLQAIKKMGPLDQLLGMIPGVGKAVQGVDDRAFVQVEAIINSMTPIERRNPQVLNGSRRRRIARGSGTTIQDVNRLVKQFEAMQKMMKQMNRFRPGRTKLRLPFPQ